MEPATARPPFPHPSPTELPTQPQTHAGAADAEPMRVENLTAHRIAISRRDRRSPLVLAPFGAMALTARELEELDPAEFAAWKDGGLVAATARRRASRLLPARWLHQAAGLLLVAAIGFGLPVMLVYSYSDEAREQWLRAAAGILGGGSGQMPSLVLPLFLAFMGIVSTLPALLYFLFGHNHLRAFREKFYRAVVRLDPQIETVTDARAIYGPQIRDAYGSGEGSILLRLNGIPVLLATFLVTVGWCASLLPTRPSPESASLKDLFVPHQTLITFAFLGVYFFSLNMLLRRYARGDLGSQAYIHLSARIVVALVSAIAMPAIPGLIENDRPTALALGLAFLVGVFPEVTSALFHRGVLGQAPLFRRLFPPAQDDDPLTCLEGITPYDRARLLEEGIENVENLAHHDLIELILRTRIPAPRLVDLVDQAILYLHTREPGGAAGEAQAAPARLKELRRLGIRTATDLEGAWEAARKDGTGALPGTFGSREEQLRVELMLKVMANDEWLAHLRYWRRMRQGSERPWTLDDFSRRQGPRAPSRKPRPSPGATGKVGPISVVG